MSAQARAAGPILVAIDVTELSSDSAYGQSEPVQVRLVEDLVRHAPHTTRFVLLTRPSTAARFAHLESPRTRRVPVSNPGRLEILLSRLDARLPAHTLRARLATETALSKQFRHARARLRPGFLARLGVDALLRPYVASTLDDPTIPLVAAVDDLQHVSHPHLLTSRERAHRARSFENMRRRAARIVVTTACLHEVVVTSEHVCPERVVVVPPGRLVGRGPAPREVVRASLGRYELDEQGYYAVPGNFERRHNQMVVLTALGILRARAVNTSIKLVIPATASGQAVARLRFATSSMGLAENVRIIDGLSASEVRLLIQGSRAVIVPWLYDTVGQAVLDALSAARPIVWSGIPGLHDVVGDAGLTFDPHRPADLAAVLARLHDTPALLDDLERAARQRLGVLQSAAEVGQTFLDLLGEARNGCRASR